MYAARRGKRSHDGSMAAYPWRIRGRAKMSRDPAARTPTRRRAIMVGVNMVLAEFIKFKHGLYKCCGINVHHARSMFTPTMFSRGRPKLDRSLIPRRPPPAPSAPAGPILYYTILYDTIRYDTIPYDTILYDTIRYDTML